MSQHWNVQRIDEAYLNITSTTIDEENELFVYLLSQNCVGCPFKYYPVEQVNFSFWKEIVWRNPSANILKPLEL